jgi:hypothetical protein
MSETVYYPEVECDATPSDLHETEVVGVPDDTGNRQFLRVGKGFLTRVKGKTYLPIAVVELDYQHERALVQLPYEADSGANRIWVKFNSFRQAKVAAKESEIGV